MSELSLIQFLILFALSLTFTVLSIDRETMITFLLAGILWIATGLINYTLNPLGQLSMILSYVCIGLGAIFFFATLKALVDATTEKKQERFRVGL